ncbi:MAG: glycosyltransferase [Chloroflexota bacterium]
MVPSSPGAFGPFEAAVVLALSLYGVEESRAFGYGFGLHAFTNISLIVLGLWGLRQESVSFATVREKVLEQQEDTLKQEKRGVKSIQVPGEPPVKKSILFVLTYYRPHVSGLTIYVERLAKELARRGHPVTVLTSQYEKRLPREEIEDGVRIVRAPVLLRISKGVIMPTFGLLATRLVLQHDLISLHLPQFDAAGVALRGRLLHKPTVLTYHCDLKLPPGWFNGVTNQVVHLMNRIAGHASDAIVSYTHDFASHSPYLTRFSDKVHIIPPPVEMECADDETVASFAKEVGLRKDQPIVGFVARLAAEKGVEVMLQALPHVLEEYPETRVLFAGQHEKVLGEEAYARRLEPLLEKHADRWTFLGVLSPQELSAFYPNCDVVVLPSLNSTESFGLVQVEAMLCGTPSVASNLPGVRQPVRQTGMGKVVPVGDSEALAKALVDVLDDSSNYIRPREEIMERFSTKRTADGYEILFEELWRKKRGGDG